ncbi:hypothetical protein GCM10023314_04230 [Algibacter agarivorans]|uniref:Lipocalin-like domain-containing protein n=2 Tax=Algibacter agarivorans TaxID=1109741 RepID=A0ABP9GA84_9FLAO
MIVISCNNSKERKEKTFVDDTNKEELTLIGTWERTSYYNYIDNVIVDSFVTTPSNRHVKMFSPKKVMWCRNVSADSTEWFGYGSYTLKDSLLTEVLEFGSKAMKFYISKEPTFVFKCNIKKDRYTQIQIDEEGHPIFAENYDRIE